MIKKYETLYSNFTHTLAYLWYLVPSQPPGARPLRKKMTNNDQKEDLTRILYIIGLYIIRTLLKEIDVFLREISLKIAKFS